MRKAHYAVGWTGIERALHHNERLSGANGGSRVIPSERCGIICQTLVKEG
jgi:hypothetical protein